MPYKDRQRHNEYTRKISAQRRADWFAGKACEECNSTEDLQLDHRDPKTKVDHRVWSWSKERRDSELAKCRPLCRPCHVEKSSTEQPQGEDRPGAKLTEEIIREIRASSDSYRVLAERYGVVFGIIGQIKRREAWKHVL